MVTAITLACIATLGSAQVIISWIEPRSLVFHGDYDTFTVRPGNEGRIWFRDTPTSHPSNLAPWQDEYCNASWLQVDSMDYTVHPWDMQTTSGEIYWLAMNQWIRNCDFNGELPVWLLSDDVVKRGNRDGFLDDLTSRAMLYPESRFSGPAFVMAPESWSVEHTAVKDRLTSNLQIQPVGVHITINNYHQVPSRGWGFVVIDEEVIPETYRGQAAASWAWSQYGQLPVFLSPMHPHFQRDVIWASTGIAGIWYRPLAAPGSAENEAEAIHLRASSTYLKRFGIRMNLLPRPLTGRALFTIHNEAGIMANLFAGGTGRVVMDLPGDLQGVTAGRSWFNPATDENIVQPLTTLGSQLDLTPPSQAMWMQNIIRTESSADTATTVTGIKALDL